MQAEPTNIRAKIQLALEIRSQRFSFAVVEGTHLLDWGGCVCPAGSSPLLTAARKLDILLISYNPAIVMWRDPRGVKGPNTKRALRIAKVFQTKLDHQSIPCAVVARNETTEFFAQRGCHTKYEIAVYIANKFPPLESSLPSRRKTWEPERYGAAVFDAVASLDAFNGQINGVI